MSSLARIAPSGENNITRFWVGFPPPFVEVLTCDSSSAIEIDATVLKLWNSYVRIAEFRGRGSTVLAVNQRNTCFPK